MQPHSSIYWPRSEACSKSRRLSYQLDGEKGDDIALAGQTPCTPNLWEHTISVLAFEVVRDLLRTSADSNSCYCCPICPDKSPGQPRISRPLWVDEVELHVSGMAYSKASFQRARSSIRINLVLKADRWSGSKFRMVDAQHPNSNQVDTLATRTTRIVSDETTVHGLGMFESMEIVWAARTLEKWSDFRQSCKGCSRQLHSIQACRCCIAYFGTSARIYSPHLSYWPSIRLHSSETLSPIELAVNGNKAMPN